MENPSLQCLVAFGESSTQASEIDSITQAQTCTIIKIEPATQTQTYTAEELQMIEAEIARLKKVQPEGPNQKVAAKVRVTRAGKMQRLQAGSRNLKDRQQEQTQKTKASPNKKKTKTKPELSCVHCAHINWSSMFRMKELAFLKERVEVLKNEKLLLQKQLRERDSELEETRSEYGTIQTKINGKQFSSDIRQTVFHCLANQVPPQNIETLMRTAVKLLAKRELSHFPNVETIRLMRRDVARIQKTQEGV